MELVRQWGLIVLLGLVGVGLIGYGVWDQIRPSEVVVEIVKGNENTSRSEIGTLVVDVSGAVEKPGVYKLPTDARVGDALVVAGGLSAVADREWVSATLNLAAKVEDGAKIYIPKNSESDTVEANGEVRAQKNQKININTASLEELDQLDGIGESRARAIIENRPYGSTQELVTKAKIPQTVYDKISGDISIY